MSVATDYISQLSNALRVGGTSAMFVRAKDPTAPALPVRFLLSHPLRRDEAVVNAYGIDALVLTFSATPEFVAVPPERFDQIVLDGALSYVIDSCLMRQVLNVPVAFTAYIKGKGT